MNENKYLSLEENFTGAFLKFIFNWEGNCFTILCWFPPHINMSRHRYTYALSLWNLPPTFPTSSHPLGCQGALHLSFLLHIANSQWLSILHMVLYMFPCYSLNSFHPLFPHFVHKSFLSSLRFHCCRANKFISTIFLDSI